MNPKISVIVPIYNVEQYIAECLESLIGQTMEDIEIICVDDCGKDKSMDIVREYATRDRRIKILTHQKNSGLSAARNTGIANSSAPYVMCCDSDDFYAPDMCEKMYDAIHNSGADAAICGTHVIYEADENEREADNKYFAIDSEGLFDMNSEYRCDKPVTAWNKIYRRDIIEQHGCEFPVGLRYEDEYFWRAYSIWCKNIYTVPDKLYNYRRRPGSIMNQTLSHAIIAGNDCISIGMRYYEYLCAHKAELAPIYFDEFWTKLWLGWVRTACYRCEGYDDAMAQIKKTVAAFVTKNYKFGTQAQDTERVIRQMKHGTFMSKKRKFGGLYYEKETDDTRVIRVCGIPIWRIKYFTNRTHYHLLGAKIASRYTGPRSTFKISHFRPQQFDDSQLVTELKKMGEFTFIPNPGNMGDMLIAAATFGFFDKHGIKYKIFDGTPADNVVYGGGGVWVSQYKSAWLPRLDIFRNAKRVLILPHTFDECPELIDVMDERFVVFCRERRSYDYLVAQNTGARILLDHDMAFHLSRKTLQQKFQLDSFRKGLLRQLNSLGIGRVAKLMREDRERVQDIPTYVDLSGILPYCAEDMIVKDAVFVAQQMLATVDRAEIIITDRLHVAIAGLLMGKTVYMLDNLNKKLSGVMKQSMANFKNVHFCETMPDMTRL